MEIARLFYSAIGQHRVVSIAAGVTFFALLAMFPAIAALVSVYGIFQIQRRSALISMISHHSCLAEPSRSLETSWAMLRPVERPLLVQCLFLQSVFRSGARTPE